MTDPGRVERLEASVERRFQTKNDSLGALSTP